MQACHVRVLGWLSWSLVLVPLLVPAPASAGGPSFHIQFGTPPRGPHYHGPHYHGPHYHGYYHPGYYPYRPYPVYVPAPVIVAPRPTVSYLLAPPPGHVVVEVNGATYYRVGSTFYRPTYLDGRYVYSEVAEPVGTIMPAAAAPNPAPSLAAAPAPAPTFAATPRVSTVADSAARPEPARPEPVQPASANDEPQYLNPQPKVGSVLERLPDGATSTTVNNTSYFVVGKVVYLPIQVNGKIQYVVVDPR